ncbi:MAG: histidinol-phosphatase [Ignavibacteria bacterium]|nr:histidinol-phosphatase [Ignavibacteria bacterium]
MTDQILAFINDIAINSGKIIKQYYRTNFQIESKLDQSPVTIADKKAEEYLRERIMKEFPDHGIIGEEFGSYNEHAEYTWILDPIDGTKSFIHGVPLFGTLIALKHKDEIPYGAFHQPILDELLIGSPTGTTFNSKPVKVRKTSSLAESTLLLTDHLSIGKYQSMPPFEQLIRTVKIYRTWGDCYGYALLAAGYADIMIDAIMNMWDICALVPIIRGAGGIITDYQGNTPINANSIIAATPEVHAEVVRLLNMAE